MFRPVLLKDDMTGRVEMLLVRKASGCLAVQLDGVTAIELG